MLKRYHRASKASHVCARAVGQFRELVQWAEQDRAVCETVKKVCLVVHVTLQVAVQCMQISRLQAAASCIELN